MEPLQTTAIKRPFHWGIVILVGDDWTGDIPEIAANSLVSANARAVSVGVRHAQDTDEYEGEHVRFAEASVAVRLFDAVAQTGDSRREVFRGVINVPSGRLCVGDADEETVVPAHRGKNVVVVSVDPQLGSEDLSPDAIQVDLLPG